MRRHWFKLSQNEKHLGGKQTKPLTKCSSTRPPASTSTNQTKLKTWCEAQLFIKTWANVSNPKFSQITLWNKFIKLNMTIFKQCYCWLGVWKHSTWIHDRQTHKQNSISKQKAPWIGVYHYISLNSIYSPQPKSNEKHSLWSDIGVRLISQLAICCPEVKMIW